MPSNVKADNQYFGKYRECCVVAYLNNSEIEYNENYIFTEEEKINLEKQVNELTTAHTADETKLKEHETAINELTSKFTSRLIDAKIKENLLSAGVKHPELLTSQIDKSTLEYDEESNEIKNIDEVVKTLQDKYSDMFNSESKFKDKVKPQKNNTNDAIKIDKVERYFNI